MHTGEAGHACLWRRLPWVHLREEEQLAGQGMIYVAEEGPEQVLVDTVVCALAH